MPRVADPRLVARLLQTPEWAELTATAEEAKTQYFDTLSRHLYSGREITDVDLAYKRGWWRGIAWLLKQPTANVAEMIKAADTKETDA